jgi:hypothetical protein
MHIYHFCLHPPTYMPQTIVSSLSVAGIHEYIASVRVVFLHAAKDSGPAEEGGADGQCEWALDQVSLLVFLPVNSRIRMFFRM